MNEFFDSSNQFWNTFKDAPANSLACNFAEPSFHKVQPRRTGQREMQVETRMVLEPCFHIRVVVSAIVIQDEMEESQSPGSFTINLTQELQNSSLR